MKTTQNQSVTNAKGSKINAQRARARAGVNLALGLITPSEAAAVRPVKSGRGQPVARGWSNGSKWVPSAVHRAGAVEVLPVVDERAAAAARIAAANDAARIAAGGKADALTFATFCAALVAPVESLAVESARWDGDAWRAGESIKSAGLLSAADVAALRHPVKLAAVESARVAARGLLSARAAGNLHQIARLHRLAASGDVLVTCDADGRLVVDVPAEDGDGKRQGVASAPLGSDRPDLARRRINSLAAVAGLSVVGSGWHLARSIGATDQLQAAMRVEFVAKVRGVLALGYSGRVHARAARIAWAMAGRWMRQNSRREALSLREVGAAAGVDDLRAGADWSLELAAIARDCHFAASAFGLALLDLASDGGAASVDLVEYAARSEKWSKDEAKQAARMIEARAEVEAIAANLAMLPIKRRRRVVFGRGVRPDGLPVVEWRGAGDSLARFIREDSIRIVGRGIAWQWASKFSARAMQAARYGRGGRDGKEVSAGWSITGKVGGKPGEIWGGKVRTVRPSFLISMRAALAGEMRAARVAVSVARLAADVAKGSEAAQRMAAGVALGAAAQAEKAVARRCKLLSDCMRGWRIEGAAVDRLFNPGKRSLTGAGRMVAKDVRARMPHLAREVRPVVAVAVEVRPIDKLAGIIPGDELAASETVASYSAR